MNKLIIKEYFSYSQGGIDMYMMNVKCDDLLERYKVDYYNGDELDIKNGYQRKLVRSHYMKIVSYLLNDYLPILPTAILAAVNDKSVKVINSELEIYKKIRIVDGQHRLKALRVIRDDYPEIYNDRYKNMDFPVILMLLDKNEKYDRTIEIRSFIDINKKGKKVSTDLAKTIIDPVIENLIDMDQSHETQRVMYISTKVTKKLNRDIYSNWFKSIRLGDGENKGRIIGLSMFSESIEPIIKKLFEKEFIIYDNESVIENVDYISELINNAWCIIGDKWIESFYWDTEHEVFRVDKDYNIQKGIGVYPLHGILSDIIKTVNSDDIIISKFKEVIENSPVENYHWERGGEFSGYNSKKGFNKISELLRTVEEN